METKKIEFCISNCFVASDSQVEGARNELVLLIERIAELEAAQQKDAADSCSCGRELHVTRIDVNCPEHGIKPLI